LPNRLGAHPVVKWLEESCELSHAKSEEYQLLLERQDYVTVESLLKTPPSEDNLRAYGITIGRHSNAIVQQIKKERVKTTQGILSYPILLF
jgi:hypothetical protein